VDREIAKEVTSEFQLSDGTLKTLRVPLIGTSVRESHLPEKQALVAPTSRALHSVDTSYCTIEYGLPRTIKYLSSDQLLVFYISAVLTARIHKEYRVLAELYLPEYILRKYQGELNIMKRFIIYSDLININFESFILKEFDSVKFNGLCGMLGMKTNIRRNGERITLREYIESFQIIYSIREKRKPKRTIRRRGYKDHGSLGSEYSHTVRDQAKTGEFQEIARREIKENILRQFPEAQDNPVLLKKLLGE
jgi:hypothetical protein